MQGEDEKEYGKGKRPYLRQTEVPSHTLFEALRVAKAISENYGGDATEPIDVAAALKIKPTTGRFRSLTGATVAYELTEGASNASSIGLTDLGRRAVMPTEVGDDVVALREALLKPRVIREFLTKYDGKKLPPPDIARNVLVKLGVPPDMAEKTARIILGSAKEADVLQDINGEMFVHLRGAARPRVVEENRLGEQEEPQPEDAVLLPLESSDPEPLKPEPVKPIFVGHGKKTGPLDKLVKMLKELNIPYKIAVGEPNLGRPIPTKVKDVMAECGSAILLFTKDEQFQDSDGNEVWRPSENVVYELGASSFAYGDRIVIFMENGLHFPANFESVGRINFDEDGIEAKSMELLKELVGFGLVKITPAA